MVIKLNEQQIAHYQCWEKKSRSDLPGRYSIGFEEAPAFALYDDDFPRVAGHVECEDRDGLTRVHFMDESESHFITVAGASSASIKRLFATFDGRTSFKSACESASPDLVPERLRTLCQSLLGRAIFIDAAVQSLEQQLRRFEIVRFPLQSPYLVSREYWSNSRDVRVAVPTLFHSLGALPAFKDALADLHIMATMGSRLDTYYGGSGGVATIPGGYRVHALRTGLSEGKARFIDRYLKDIGLSGLREDERLVFSEAGVLLGCVAGQGRVFRHPPADNNHLDMILDGMRMALLAVARLMEQGKREDLLAAISRFHKLFLHAHPFYNINNSVAMNIVNYCLERSGCGVIPHLVLDFIALRTEFGEYALVFDKAVKDYGFAAPAAEVDKEVMERIAHYHAQLQLQG